MSDGSVRPANAGGLRAADVLLRSLGGCQVFLRMPMSAAAGLDGEQLGLFLPAFQDLPLAPAVFRKARVPMAAQQDGTKYELLLSASAVAGQVSATEIGSADVLFAMATGFTIAGRFFLIEATSFTEWMGSACLYRVLLREAALDNA